MAFTTEGTKHVAAAVDAAMARAAGAANVVPSADAAEPAAPERPSLADVDANEQWRREVAPRLATAESAGAELPVFKRWQDDDVERELMREVMAQVRTSFRWIEGNGALPVSDDALYRVCKRFTVAYEKIADLDEYATMSPGEIAEIHRATQLFVRVQTV